MGLNIRPNLEIVSREGASGGKALGVFEGGGGNHTWLGGLSCSIDIGTAEYPFEVPAPGGYVVWARCWWSDKCGNSILVDIDGREQYDIGDHSKEDPILKTWHWMPSRVFELNKGAHTLNAMAKEDGAFVDQWFIAPTGTSPSGIGKPTVVPGLASEPPSALSLSVSRGSEVIDRDGKLKFVVWIRKCREGEIAGKLVTEADESPVVDVGRELDFEMEATEVLRPVPLVVTFPADSRHSEKRIVFSVRQGDLTLSKRAIVVAKPFRWHLLGPLAQGASLESKFGYGLKVDTSKPVPDAGDGTQQQAAKWELVEPQRVLNRYNTFDFEKLYGDSFDKCVYLYTTVISPSDQSVLMLVNNDDCAWVWVNGTLAFQDLESHPAEGYLGRTKVQLKKGENPVLVKVTQSDSPDRTSGMESPNYWLFRLRLRESNHRPAEIWGK